MKYDKFIEYIYNLFSNFGKPEMATDVNHCQECRDHNDEIAGADRKDLTPGQIGTVSWGISPFLTPEAMGYYLPRFIELAITAANDKVGEPYMCTFINQIGMNSRSDQFSYLSSEQKQAVCDSLKILREQYSDILEEHCWDEDIKIAIGQWST